MKIDRVQPALACGWWSKIKHPCYLGKQIGHKHISYLPLQYKHPLLPEIHGICIAKYNFSLTIIL